MTHHDPTDSIRNRSQQARATGDPSDVRDCLDRTARLVLRALQDEEHPFNERVQALSHLIRTNNFNTVTWYLPRPGSTIPDFQQLAPVQFLLLAASMKEGAAYTLSDVMKLSESEVEKARDLAKQSLADRSGIWWLDQLDRALPLVAHTHEHVPVFRLEGRDLFHQSREAPVRLSQQEAQFMSLLIEQSGLLVLMDAFREAGIGKPADRKLGVVQKLTQAGISTDAIVTGQGGYVLTFNS